MSQEERHVKTGRRPTIASSIDPPLSQRFAHSFEPSREMSQPETAAPLTNQRPHHDRDLRQRRPLGDPYRGGRTDSGLTSTFPASSVGRCYSEFYRIRGQTELAPLKKRKILLKASLLRARFISKRFRDPGVWPHYASGACFMQTLLRKICSNSTHTYPGTYVSFGTSKAPTHLSFKPKE